MSVHQVEKTLLDADEVAKMLGVKPSGSTRGRAPVRFRTSRWGATGSSAPTR